MEEDAVTGRTSPRPFSQDRRRATLEGMAAIRGEVRLAVEREMAATLIDVMDRRTALLLFSPNSGLAGAEKTAAIMGSILGWDAEWRSSEVAAYRDRVEEHHVPVPGQ